MEVLDVEGHAAGLVRMLIRVAPGDVMYSLSAASSSASPLRSRLAWASLTLASLPLATRGDSKPLQARPTDTGKSNIEFSFLKKRR